MIEIREQPPDFLSEYVQVPMSFEVTGRFVLTASDRGHPELDPSPRAVDPAWLKDYDALPDGHPFDWPRRFDLTNWGFLSAHVGGRYVGGTAIAHATPSIEMLEAREDLAVIWDLRVAPELRRRGVGRRLLTATDEWAHSRGCGELKVETQNTNVPACRLYSDHGFTLTSIQENAYPDLPGEIQIVWRKHLDGLSSQDAR